MYLDSTPGYLHRQSGSLEGPCGACTILPRRGAQTTGRKRLHVRACIQCPRSNAAPHLCQSDKPDGGMKQRDEDARWLKDIVLSGGTIKPQIVQS